MQHLQVLSLLGSFLLVSEAPTQRGDRYKDGYTDRSCDDRTGTLLLDPKIVSVPFNGKGFDTGTTPITGDNPRNGTNTTLAAPYTPAGGDQDPKPVYRVQSNFDFQSLGLDQELIELDLFHNGLARFSPEEFEAVGLTAEDRYLIKFMANQEVGHPITLTNMIGPDRAAKQSIYQYPYEFILFCQLLTRFGESGTLGFLPHLYSRPTATPLGHHHRIKAADDLPPVPRPVPDARFETGVRQAYQWTLLAPYIKSCPRNNPRIEFQNFSTLVIENQPFALGGHPAISTNRSLTAPGRKIELRWEATGKVVGYDGLYRTAPVAGAPKYAASISQLNVIYAPLYNLKEFSASLSSPLFARSTLIAHLVAAVKQPDAFVFPTQPQVNDTMFVSIGDEALFLTPYNISLINHTVAGPALYQSG